MAKSVILDHTGKPFTRPDPRRKVRINASYDAAKTTTENSRHWANADGMSAASANSLAVRDTLRKRARYEFDNNGYCSGMIRGRADDLVGIGPTLQILSEDDLVNDRIEEIFSKWMRATSFAEKLHTMDQSRNRDGEAFAVLISNPTIADPVKLDLDLIECDRVTDSTFLPDDSQIDGIKFDKYGNPTTYNILRNHPGDQFSYAPVESDKVPARYVLHWFRKDRPGQARGIPELTSSLPVFAYLRRYTLATLSAAEIAASFAATLETELGADEEDPPVPFDSIEIERGMMMTVPSGSKMHQFDPSQPTATFKEFKKENLKECARPLRMPGNVAMADSSDSNFSSAKLDHYGYRGGIGVDRYFTEIKHLEKVFLAWLEEARLIPGYLPVSNVDALPRAWYWPGWASMDKDDAKNDTERLNNGTTTLSELLAEWGMDWKKVIRQRGRELRFMQEQGVGQTAPAAPEPVTEEPQDDAEEETKDDMKQPANSRLNGHLNGFLNGKH